MNAFAQKQHIKKTIYKKFIESSQKSHLRALAPKLDSMYFWSWDTINLAYNVDVRMINIVYDANNNLTNELWQTWDGTAWVNSSQTTYTYDANNNQISWLEKTWDGIAWVNNLQHIYTFDANNNQTSYIEDSNWNGTTWGSNGKHVYTYDANNNQTIDLSQSWNDPIWVDSYRNIYTYDANNNKISDSSQWMMSGAWDKTGRIKTYTYDANNNLTSELEQMYNGTSWDNSDQYTYTNDTNNNQTNKLHKTWNGTAWVNVEQSIYTYDYRNNPMSALNQYWINGTWVNSYQWTDIYDANSLLKSEVSKNWNTNGKVTSGDSAYVYFHTAFVCPSSAHYTTVYDTVQNTFTLTLDSPSSATYHWDFGDGSTSTLATPTHLYTVDTVYNVCLRVSSITSGDSCTYCHLIGKDYLGNIYRTSGFTLNVVNTNTQTGITQYNTTTDINVYPNPTSGVINLQMTTFENVQIKIYNAYAGCIYQNSITSSNFQIDLSSQANGVYFMQIKTGESIINKKLIIQK